MWLSTGTLWGDPVSDDDGPQRLPGRLSRTWKTALLTGSVGTKLVGGRVLDAFRKSDRRRGAQDQRHFDAAVKMVSTMQELRGPLLKVGQLLATHTEALPGAYAEVLRPLQQDAPPMSYQTIREVVRGDLGEAPDTLFKTFSEDAVAAASLGQVHRATLDDGTEVAVKVQYPGAEQTVDGDMKNLETGAALLRRLLVDTTGNKRLDVTPIVEEVAEHLRQETDYCREAYNAKLLGALFDGHPDIVVPRVFDSHSGLRVITYDWIEGTTLDEELSHPDRERRQDLAVRLLHSFYFQVLQGGLLHADPHPGNYRVLKDGRVGLLDYGCVKVFGEHFMKHFRAMVRSRIEGDAEALRASMIALELLDDPDSDREVEEITRICDYCAAGLVEEGAFDFSSFDYVGEAQRLVRFFLGRRRLPPAHKDFLFLTRVVLGYYEYLARAEAAIDLKALVRPYVEGEFTGRAVVIPYYGD